MRHRVPPKPGLEWKMKWYRIRYKALSKAFVAITGSDTATAHPGIIKNNLPKAEKYLTRMTTEGFEAWIEVSTDRGETWEKFNG